MNSADFIFDESKVYIYSRLDNHNILFHVFFNKVHDLKVLVKPIPTLDECITKFLFLNDQIVANVFMKAALTKVQEILRVKFSNVNTKMEELKELQVNLTENYNELLGRFEQNSFLYAQKEKAKNLYKILELSLVKWKQLQQEGLELEILENLIKELKDNLVLLDKENTQVINTANKLAIKLKSKSEILSEKSSAEEEVKSLLGTAFLDVNEKKNLSLLYENIHINIEKINAASSKIEIFMKIIKIQTNQMFTDKALTSSSEEKRKEFLDLFTDFSNASQDIEISYKKVLQIIKEFNYYYFHSRRDTQLSELYDRNTIVFKELKYIFGIYWLKLNRLLIFINAFSTVEKKKDIAETLRQFGLELEILEDMIKELKGNLVLLDEKILHIAQESPNKAFNFFMESFFSKKEKQKVFLLYENISEIIAQITQFSKERVFLLKTQQHKQFAAVMQRLKEVTSSEKKHLEFLNLFGSFTKAGVDVGFFFKKALQAIKEINDYFCFTSNNNSDFSELHFKYLNVDNVKYNFWLYKLELNKIITFINSMSTDEEKRKKLMAAINDLIMTN